MIINTDKNPVILIGELANEIVRRSFQSKLGFRPKLTKDELKELFGKIEAALMTLKYSYLPLNELLIHPELKKLENLGGELQETIKPGLDSIAINSLNFNNISWGANIFLGLSRRLKYSSDKLGAGVDLKVVHVQNVKTFGKLAMTRAYDKLNKYQIMTNLLDIKPNRNLAVAILPPAEIGGQISNAMYLGLNERPEDAGYFLDPNTLDLKEVNAVLHNLLLKK